MTLILTTCDEDGGRRREETFDAAELTDPAEVGRRRRRDNTVAVQTQEEAERWGRDMVAAFNRTRYPGEVAREFVSARLED